MSLITFCFSFLSFIALPGLLPTTQPTDEDELVIYSPHKTYHYQATFIDPAGDTLSQERLTIKPTGKPWIAQKNQTAYEVIYNYTPEDSITFLSYINPTSENRDEPKPFSWVKSITTGAIENDEEVWMHPIRENQYRYTEIAPFPKVELGSLKPGKTWNSTMYIMTGWGAFKGKTESKYHVIKQEVRQYGDLTLDGCWLVQAKAKHSPIDRWWVRLLVGKGKELEDSNLTYYFHPDYGFVEMNYEFYDGVKIHFMLEEVEENAI